MRLTRHARNRMRLYDISRAEALAIVETGRFVGFDERGNPGFTSWVDNREICVIVAGDDPATIITLYEARSR